MCQVSDMNARGSYSEAAHHKRHPHSGADFRGWFYLLPVRANPPPVR